MHPGIIQQYSCVKGTVGRLLIDGLQVLSIVKMAHIPMKTNSNIKKGIF